MSVSSLRHWTFCFLVTIFGALISGSYSFAANSVKDFKRCERRLNRVLLQHLADLRFTERGAQDAIDGGGSFDAALEPALVAQLIEVSKTGNVDAFQAWREGLEKPDKSFGILDQLPRLSLLTPNLDWLPKILARRETIPYWELTDLIKWAPVWQNSPQADQVRDVILDRISTVKYDPEIDLQVLGVKVHSAGALLTWFIDHADAKERSELQKWAVNWIEQVVESSRKANFADTSYWFVSLPTIVPYKMLPASVRKEFEADWLNFKTNPAITLDSKIGYTLQEVDAGSCEMMFHGHVCSLLPALLDFDFDDTDDFPGKYILIRVGGHLLGSLKAGITGDPSILSFRNVQDETGRLVTLAGGIYRMSAATNNLIRARLGASPHKRPGSTVTMNRIDVSPLSFLINEQSSDTNVNVERMHTIGGYMNLRELRRYTGVRDIDAWTVLKRSFQEIVDKEE